MQKKFKFSEITVLLLVVALKCNWASPVNGDEQSPQMMWNPEKGSINGEDLFLFSSMNVTRMNQTAQKGSTVFLRCQVRNMADKKISWIRRRDNHILTSGIQSYSSDDRFNVVKDEELGDWSLQIKFVQPRDQGQYECQVSTKTGQYGYLIDLSVITPTAKIDGPTDIHVQSGSRIVLLCRIEKSIRAPQYMFWYRNKQMINYDQSRGGITVETKHSPQPTSKLTVTGALYKDSGNYTCSASNTESASVSVFVSEGDIPAAIQRLGSGGPGILHVPVIYLLSFALPAMTTLRLFGHGALC